MQRGIQHYHVSITYKNMLAYTPGKICSNTLASGYRMADNFSAAARPCSAQASQCSLHSALIFACPKPPASRGSNSECVIIHCKDILVSLLQKRLHSAPFIHPLDAYTCP
eukprot:1160158-Pelagomonas_calceolata.AAC.4